MLEEFLISNQATLRDALISMTTHRRGLLFIIDPVFRLIGVLSDGDVRRSLLQNTALDSPIEKWMNLNPTTAISMQEAQSILTERPFLVAIPVIEAERKIVGVCFFDTGGKITFCSKTSSIHQTENKVKFLAVIPARGGSKRIPYKNLVKIGKHSLLGLAIKCAKETPAINDILVSTDDKDIAEEARRYGVKVEWWRPAELAADNGKTIDVLKFELLEYTQRKGFQPQFCILLEPTAPLRTPEILTSAIETFNANGADSLVSVTKLRHNFHPEEILRIQNGKYLSPYLPERNMDSRIPRQKQEPLYVQNGLIYITNYSVIVNEGSIYGNKVLAFDTGEGSYLDIDDLDDLEFAKFKFINQKS